MDIKVGMTIRDNGKFYTINKIDLEADKRFIVIVTEESPNVDIILSVKEKIKASFDIIDLIEERRLCEWRKSKQNRNIR
jgi:hypothetical protein